MRTRACRTVLDPRFYVSARLRQFRSVLFRRRRTRFFQRFDHLFLGDVSAQLPIAEQRFGRTAAMVHSDIGTGVAERDAKLAAVLSPLLAALVRDGGCVVSDQELSVATWRPVDLPEGVAPGRYYMYQASA